ncbi:hypothetical protein [Actinoplanes sp. NPDC051411]|uniref:hypothetical protein n=1 Tax=Actinoplanes sp. NPDC051411 TaxID=3155522 RepID=UPI003429D1F8
MATENFGAAADDRRPERPQPEDEGFEWPSAGRYDVASSQSEITAPGTIAEFAVSALISGVIGNVGYDLLKALWQKAFRSSEAAGQPIEFPDGRLVDTPRGTLDQLARLAVHAECCERNCPTPRREALEVGDWRLTLLDDIEMRAASVSARADGLSVRATVWIATSTLAEHDVRVQIHAAQRWLES